MPFSPGGVFSLVASYFGNPGDTITVEQHNPVFEDVASGLSLTLVRDGRSAMTGPLKVVDGTSSAPGIAFASDPTKGFYLDANGNIVPTAPFNGGRLIGELVPYTGLTAPAGWVLCYGQTLSRTTYAALWAFAQAEIAGGNAFYGNGDGSTTFTIGDLRGRVPAGRDTMGGTSADRLNPSITSGILGATGGAQSRSLTQGNLPSVNFSVSIPSGQGSHSHGVTVGGTSSTPAIITGNGQSGGEASRLAGPGSISIDNATLPAMTGTAASGGSGAAFQTIQPTLITNFILYAGA